MKKLFLLAIFSLILLGCNKEKYDSIPHGYYTMVYQNFAWGYTFNGWMIDSDGNVNSFNLPEGMNGADSLGYISESELIENISNCDGIIGSVTKRKLYTQNKLINKAANGAFSEGTSHGADMGQYSYYCYQFDTDVGRYKRILLHTEGDWSYYNESNEAKAITRWMKKIE
ncbi:MAG: hypothetical protein GQ574_07225 [Crocinitomix sp.]|nr:hypothetical protein [Crocinitomix sp.]